MLAFDASNLMVACLIFKYVTGDMQTVLSIYFAFTVLACILFFAIIPESPKWLFMKRGRNSQEGIKTLNYIAKFNGSKKRLPKDGVFDLIGQVIDENIADQSNISKLGINRCKQNATINQSQLITEDQGIKLSAIFKEFKLLYHDSRNRNIHNKLKFMFCCVYPIYLLALYNSSAVQGNLFILGILFGMVEVLGTVLGERII